MRERSSGHSIQLILGFLSSTYIGSIEFDRLPTDWVERITRRIETGLFTPGSRRRADYVVRSRSAEAVSFSANDFWTAFKVGLNDVELHRAEGNRVAYHGSFNRWAAYAAIQGLVVAGAVLLWSCSGLAPVARWTGMAHGAGRYSSFCSPSLVWSGPGSSLSCIVASLRAPWNA